MHIETILLGVSLLLLASVFFSKFSDRMGVPALLVFIGVGIAAGPYGFKIVELHNLLVLQYFGVIGLSFILFSGGMDTEWKSVKNVFWDGFSLSTLGVLLTALAVGVFCSKVFGFSMAEGMLLGAIISSTDAAAVFNVMGMKHVGLKGQLKPLLVLESGSNDPMAVFLTLGFISLVSEPSLKIAGLIPMFFKQMAIGAASGYIMGRIAVYTINKLKLEYEGLYPVLTLTIVMFVYGITAVLGGNGYLAVYILGLVIGNREFVHKKSLMRFHDGLAWLVQIVMFLTLGFLVNPVNLVDVWVAGILVAVFLMFFARPLSVFASLIFSKMSFREKTMVSWVGLRGVVPIMLATFPLVAGIPKAETFFNIVFFVVLASVLLQGTTVPLFAKMLKVNVPLKQKRRYPIEYEHMEGSDAKLLDIIVPYNSDAIGKSIVELELPKDSLVTLIYRGDNYFIANGSTVIEESDVLLVLANEENMYKVNEIISKQKAEEPEQNS